MPRRSALLKKDVGKNEQTITDKIQASSPIHGISSAGSHKSSRPIPAKKITCSSGNSTLKRGSQRKQEKNTSISLDRKSLQDQLKKNKKLECPKCSILFKTVSGYIYHQQRCGQEKPIITCTLCDKTYTSEAGLQYHLKVSHGTDKSSTGLEDLEAESSAVVIGNKKRKSAVRAAELIISTANADDDEVEIESTQLGGNNKDVALNKNTIKTARVALKKNGAIKCLNKECNAVFTTIPGLKYHLQKCGSDLIRFQCNKCDMTYKSEAGLKHHSKTVHKDSDYAMDVASDRDKSSYLVSGARKSTSKIKLKQAMKLSLPLRAFIHNNVNWIKESRQTTHCQITFTGWKPTTNHVRPLTENEFVGFLPDTKESPYFKLNCQRSCVEDLTKLKLFESKYVYSDANSAALFVGDPVWTVAWCPIPDDAELTEQYVAISTNKAQTHAHNIYKCETTRGIIQLWNCGKLQKRQDKIEPYLALGITYDYGPIWDMKWCPSGCWQQQTYEKSDLSSRLGLLAMACGDGKVRVLSVPQPASLRQQQKTKEVIFNIIPHAILIPKYDDITNSGQAICLAWMSSNQHRFLAAGFADGTIAIWDLMTESRLLLCNHFNESQMTRYYFPFRIIAGHDSVIRSIAWCPSNGDYFATAGHDRCIKVWDFSDLNKPIRSWKKGWFTSIVWPRHRRFLFLTEEDSTSGYGTANYTDISSRNDAQIVNLIKHSGASLAQSFSEWSTNIVSGSECGELYGFNTAQVLTSGTISTKFNQRSKYFWIVYESKIENNTQSNVSNDQDYIITYKEYGLDKTSWSKSDYSIAKPSKYNPVAASSQKPLHEAIQAVSWNPNRDCHTWLLSGSKSGMVRLHNISALGDINT